MDEKTLHTLEYFKVLERLAVFCAFSASAELARALRPTSDLDEARRRLQRTTEARNLLSTSIDVSVGGSRDVRPQIDLARRGGVLEPGDLLEVKTTLIAARSLVRTFERLTETYPHLAAIAAQLNPPSGLVDAISRAISDRGEVLDSASPKLESIRRETKIAHERLMSRLGHILNDPRMAPILQEAIITQRNGRYVIPVRAEYKSRVRSIVHDQSASGATLFVEPLVIVDLNNRWHELQLEERDEVRRIMAELSAQVGIHAEQMNAIISGLAELDLVLACAKYADELRANEPVLVEIHKTRKDHPGTTLKLFHARHPLLDPQKVVPIEVDLDEETFVVVITGPNTGGKTVTLKTVGLLVLMTQSGLHIPAQSGSTLSLFENVYADIGDEQSIEQSLSTFSGHITNIVRVLKTVDRRSLVLFDELGAGTDPQEGAALARAMLAYLLERHVTGLVATHYPELKAYAHSTPGVINASMEFDLPTLRPTYHLTIGLPGRSNALQIAERLGLMPEIIALARTTLNPEDLRADDLLDEIHHQRDLAHKARAAAEDARNASETLRAELSQRLEKVEDERLKLLEEAREESARELADLRGAVDELRRDLLRARQPLEALKPVQEKLEALQEKTEAPLERQDVPISAEMPLRLGERVRLRSIPMEGIVTTLGENEVEVQVGSLRVRAKAIDIVRKGEEIPPTTAITLARKSGKTRVSNEENQSPFYPSPGMELDLRGQRAEDALDALDRYLDNAAMAGLPFVRIIHGKGTGRLRQVVREALQGSPHVSTWENGGEKEGGEGVTVAHLVAD